MSLKKEIYQKFLSSLNEKIDSFQFTLDELSISVMNETKSTAGDKHETALSMLQLEQSRIAEHLYEAIDHKTIFSQINLNDDSSQIQSGSLVKTTKGNYFMSIALPKIIVDGISIFAISPKSPLGEQLMGKKIGDKIEVNGLVHEILEIR